jgi:sugar-specific transcriptional regulator TrmB
MGQMARKGEGARSEPVTALLGLGFTETEAALYSELLRNGPATGYRLAAAIGKAAPNVYQALETLFAKGAVMATEGRKRIFRATPVEELLGALEADFRSRRSLAREALSELAETAADDRLYQLKTVNQVFERARLMIEGARIILLHDLFPAPYAELAAPLARAQARGVIVAGIDYGATDAGDARRPAAANIPWERWPGQQISLIADSSESLFALLSHDGKKVLRGLWTTSAYVSCLNHSGLACQIQVANGLPGPLPEPIATIGLLAAHPPGLKRLLGEVSDDD